MASTPTTLEELAASVGGKIRGDKVEYQVKGPGYKATRYIRLEEAQNGAQPNLNPYSSRPDGKGEKNGPNGTYGVQPVISSTSLTPSPSINVPPAPTADKTGTNLMTQFAGIANATPVDQAAEKATDNADDAFQKMLKGIAEPVDQEKLYKKAERDAGTREKQSLVNTYQSQLNAIVAKAEADKLSLVGQGRGVEERIIGGQQAQIDREAAIQSLPIAAQLSAAQGDLAAAKEHLNTLFTMRVQDANNKAAHNDKVLQLVYGYATDKQKLALDAKKTQDDRAYDMKLRLMDDAKDYANAALEAGQTSLFASIMRLDPEDPNYANNIASYASEIQSSGGSTRTTSLIGQAERQLLNGAGYNDASIDHVAEGISEYGFDEVYAQEKADGATKTQLDALSKVYNRTPTRTEAEIKSAVTQKFAADSLSSLYTEKQLHDLAKTAGFGGFNLDSKEKEIEKYLNSPKAREDYIALLIEQERKAGRLEE